LFDYSTCNREESGRRGLAKARYVTAREQLEKKTLYWPIRNWGSWPKAEGSKLCSNFVQPRECSNSPELVRRITIGLEMGLWRGHCGSCVSGVAALVGSVPFATLPYSLTGILLKVFLKSCVSASLRLTAPGAFRSRGGFRGLALVRPGRIGQRQMRIEERSLVVTVIAEANHPRRRMIPKDPSSQSSVSLRSYLNPTLPSNARHPSTTLL
jgi:hypothetical protein